MLPYDSGSGFGAGPSGSSGGSGGSGGSSSPAGPVLQDVLSTQNGALAGGGAAVELFNTPSAYRNCLLISNAGSGVMYVGFTSDVSATKHVFKLSSGGAILLALSPQVDVWVRPDATGNDYTAHEVRMM